MTQLLVSVRNASEALAALEGGADWIDVKEPSRGALGCADMDAIATVIEAVAGRRPVSAALGELDSGTTLLAGQLPRGVELVKVGLAGCEKHNDWRAAWADVAAALPTGIGLAAVAYADWRGAAAPSPPSVLQVAIAIGCRALLIDTFDKRGPNSIDGWPHDKMSEFAAAVRAAGLRLVLAGSLTVDSIDRALVLAPDLIAVRGAACRGGREGEVDATRVRELVTALAARRADATCQTVRQSRG